jgi:hypothetical protein
MSTIGVNVRVAVDDDWEWGTTLQLFTDQGDGSVDYDSPLLAQRFEVSGDTPEHRGYGMEPYGMGPYGGGVRSAEPGGYGMGPYGAEPGGYGGNNRFVTVPVRVNQGAGVYQFGVVAYDAGGNAQGGAADEQSVFVVGTQPRPVRNFAYSSTVITGGGPELSFSFDL